MKTEAIYHDVAWHALRNVKEARPEDVQELAEAVQRLCIRFCADLVHGGDADDDGDDE